MPPPRTRPLPIGHGQTISQPYIVALMSEALELQGHERVLEIGTGSGYQTAILAQLCREVYSVEIVPSLARSAEVLLGRLGFENVHLRLGDGSLGWPEEAPFDAVIGTAAPESVPPKVLGQLKPGGRMVMPVGPQRGQPGAAAHYSRSGPAGCPGSSTCSPCASSP